MPKLEQGQVQGIIPYFQDLHDPRSHINRCHRLPDIVVISVLAVIAGADGPDAIEKWAKLNEPWLAKHLPLPHGIPSHDTIGRVLQALQPQAFQECFALWLESMLPSREPGGPKLHIAIDGKTLRRSHNKGRGMGPLHVVSAWAAQHGITLGQLATEEKSNEITAIPQLLSRLDLNGAIITIDAMGCQKSIAQQIVEGNGDYVLALKGNQETIFEAVREHILKQMESDFANVRVSRFVEEEKSHGRLERRSYFQLDAPQDLAGRALWRGLKTIGVAVREYEVQGEARYEARYYLCSLRRNGKTFAQAVRGHWRIENTLHWSLDMTFREDESRTRERTLADNLAWLRRIALSLFKQHPGKESLVMKRRMAGWSLDFLMEILVGKPT
jgi:predicted transposase YbfD/YdcC